MSTWVMGTEQLASLLLSSDLPDFDQLPGALWDDPFASAPDATKVQLAAKKQRLDGETGWPGDGGTHDMCHKPMWSNPQISLPDLQAPRAPLSREQILQKQRVLQQQQEFLQQQQMQLQQELLNQDIVHEAAEAPGGSPWCTYADKQAGLDREPPANGADSQEGFTSSLWVDEFAPMPSVWAPSTAADAAVFDNIPPPLDRADFQEGSMQPLAFADNHELHEEIPQMTDLQPEFGLHVDSAQLPANSAFLQADARFPELLPCAAEEPSEARHNLLDCIAEPSSGELGARVWDTAGVSLAMPGDDILAMPGGRSQDGWFAELAPLDVLSQASSSSGSGPHVGGWEKRSTSSCETLTRSSGSSSASRSYKGPELHLNSSVNISVPLPTEITIPFPTYSLDPVSPPYQLDQTVNEQQPLANLQVASSHGLESTSARLSRARVVAESLQGRIKGLQSSKQSAKEVGSSMAEKIAAMVRKRRAPTRDNSLGSSEDSPSSSGQLVLLPCGPIDSMASRRRFVIPPESPAESIARPIFTSAKEAILRSLGVKTSSPGGTTWLVHANQWEVDKEASLEQRSVSPLVLRNTVLALAEAMATDDQERTHVLTGLLKEEARPSGSPVQRVSFQFLQALLARKENSAVGDYVKTFSIPSKVSCSLWEFVSKLPCLGFWREGIAGSIFEAVKEYDKIHIIDFATWSDQWKAVIQQLARRPGGPPQVRFTAVFAPPGTPKGLGPRLTLELYRDAILRAAEKSGLPFEFNALESSLEDFRTTMADVRTGEAVAVNCGLRLAQLMDSSVIRWSPRDAFLQVLRDLKPVVVTMGEMAFDSNGPFFLSRVQDAYEKFSLLFDTHEELADRCHAGRIRFEQQIMSKEILNLVACEGANRYVRHERPEKWQSRMWKTGFVAKKLSDELTEYLRTSIQTKGSNYEVQQLGDSGTVSLMYKGNQFGHIMAWQPAMQLRALEFAS